MCEIVLYAERRIEFYISDWIALTNPAAQPAGFDIARVVITKYVEIKRCYRCRYC